MYHIWFKWNDLESHRCVLLTQTIPCTPKRARSNPPHCGMCPPPPCPSLSPFCFRLSWRSKAFPANSQHWTCPEHRQSLRPARAVVIVSVRREASRWSRHRPTAADSRGLPHDPERPPKRVQSPPGPPALTIRPTGTTSKSPDHSRDLWVHLRLTERPYKAVHPKIGQSAKCESFSYFDICLSRCRT